VDKYHTNLGSLFLSEVPEHVTVNNHLCSSEIKKSECKHRLGSYIYKKIKAYAIFPKQIVSTTTFKVA